MKNFNMTPYPTCNPKAWATITDHNGLLLVLSFHTVLCCTVRTVHL